MSVSTQQLRKIYSRRRVVAINFLSNISLDGTPTKKDVVRQRMSRTGGQHIRITPEMIAELHITSEEQPTSEIKEEAEVAGHVTLRSEAPGSDSKHNRSSTLDQPSSLTLMTRQRTTSGQYTRSISSADEPQSATVLSSPNTHLSAKSFSTPTGPARLLTSSSVDRRSELSNGYEPLSVMSLANAVGSRLKAQLTKMDGDVACSFDALRAFGLLRTTDKKTGISFGSLLISGSDNPANRTQMELAQGNNVSVRLPSAVSRADSTGTGTNNGQHISFKSERCSAQSVHGQLTVPSNTPSISSAHKGQKQVVLLRSAEEASVANYSPTTFDELATQAASRAVRLGASQNELKRMMNEQFRARFPSLQLSLSKLLSLKRELAQVGRKCALEPAIVACAFVFFEKLVLGALIRKDNRKPCCGACLLLSAKLNDVRDEPLTMLIKELEQTFRIPRRELLAYEVAILVALEFNLNVPLTLVKPHYQRLVDSASF